MNNYRIITDSCCDLPQEMADELELLVAPLSVSYKGRERRNYLDGRELDTKEFYQGLRDGEMTSTSAANPTLWQSFMEPVLQEGQDVLVLAFSSGLSTTYNAACIAAAELKETYPDRKIYVVDTLCAALGQGLFCRYVANLKKNGATIDEARDWAESNKLKLVHWFTVEDLHFLKRGGRVSAATAVVGSMLQIKPVLHVDNEGHLIARSKVRGRKASIHALADKIGELCEDPSQQTMAICHGDCIEDAEYLAGIMKEKYHVPEVIIHPTGPVIVSHSGPGTLAVFFIGRER